MKLKIYKRRENHYSVVNVQDGREVEVAVFNYYKSAMRYVKNQNEKYKSGKYVQKK